MSIKFFGNDKRLQSLSQMGLESVLFYETAILPIPSTVDGANIKGTDIPLNSLIKEFKLIIGYRLPTWFIENCKKSKTEVYDLESDEEYLLKNAELTAEAAVCEIMRITNSPIIAQDIIIVGYGRIGFYLAEYLKCMKAKLTVLTGDGKKKEYLNKININCDGYESVEKHLCDDCLIINTAPLTLLNGLSFDKAKAMLIDLNSSKPEEIEKAEADFKEYNILPGLPGKYFPKASAKIIYERIIAIKEEINRGKN